MEIKRKIITLLCTGLVGFGCTKYDVEEPQLPIKLSAYGLMQDSLPASLWLGYANNKPSSDFAKLSGPAEVRLFRDGNFWQELKEAKDGFYLSMDSVEAGHHYEVQAQTEEGPVSADTYFTKAPRVSVALHDSSATGYSGDTLLKYKTVIEIEQRDSVSPTLYVQFGKGSGSRVSFGGSSSTWPPEENPRFLNQTESEVEKGLFQLVLGNGQKQQFTFYSRYKQVYAFNFYSESYYTLLNTQELGVNDFGAFYQPPAVFQSDFEGALGYFGWMHRSGILGW